MSTDQRAGTDLAGIDLYDPDGYVAGPPHDTFTRLRRERPVWWQDMPTARATGPCSATPT